MGSNKVMSTSTPVDPSDLINKQYFDLLTSRVTTIELKSDDDLRHIENKFSLKLNKKDIDSLFVKNSVGFIPDLDKPKSGFKVKASSELPGWHNCTVEPPAGEPPIRCPSCNTFCRCLACVVQFSVARRPNVSCRSPNYLSRKTRVG